MSNDDLKTKNVPINQPIRGIESKGNTGEKDFFELRSYQDREPIKVIEPINDLVKKGFELGSYQDREPNSQPAQAPAQSPQSAPVSTTLNDTDTTTSDK